MKKLIALLLASLMALTLSLSGLAEGETTELPWPKYDTLQTVNLWLCSNYPTPDTPLVEEAINKISEERYNIHYNLTVSEYSQYTSQINLALTSENECDIYFNMDVLNTVKNGQVYDITDFFNNDPHKDMVFEWGDRYMGIYYYGGRLYGLRPLNSYGFHRLSTPFRQRRCAPRGLSQQGSKIPPDAGSAHRRTERAAGRCGPR